jgi:DNA polymerase eta
LGISTVGELASQPLPRLEQLFGNSTALWLWKISRGMDEDKVEDRKLAKSLSCGKTFYGRTSLRTFKEVERWLLELAGTA